MSALQTERRSPTPTNLKCLKRAVRPGQNRIHRSDRRPNIGRNRSVEWGTGRNQELIGTAESSRRQMFLPVRHQRTHIRNPGARVVYSTSWPGCAATDAWTYPSEGSVLGYVKT